MTDTTGIYKLTQNGKELQTLLDSIPSEANKDNQVALASNQTLYITADASGNNFESKEALTTATDFYYNGTKVTPNKNNYVFVESDEDHSESKTMYICSDVSSTTLTWTYVTDISKKDDSEKVEYLQITLNSSNWNNSTKTQTITLTGLKDYNRIFYSPDATSLSVAMENKVYMSARSGETLTFICETIPTSDIIIDIQKVEGIIPYFYIDTENYISLLQWGSPSSVSLEYSTDGKLWTDTPINHGFNPGGKTYFRNKLVDGTFSDSNGWYHFKSDSSAKVGGNIQSLLSKDLSKTTVTKRCFTRLFSDNGTSDSKITDASKLVLPATMLEEECYSGMFYGCTSLTKAPDLPATTLAKECYWYMFHGCTSLTKAPELLATTTFDGCYDGMFGECTSLKEVPEVLPATNLAKQCYISMFSGCTSLTKAPKIVAANADTSQCCMYMFNNCSSLKIGTSDGTQVCKFTSITGNMACYDMFTGTGGTFTGTPVANTTYYYN